MPWDHVLFCKLGKTFDGFASTIRRLIEESFHENFEEVELGVLHDLRNLLGLSLIDLSILIMDCIRLVEDKYDYVLQNLGDSLPQHIVFAVKEPKQLRDILVHSSW